MILRSNQMILWFYDPPSTQSDCQTVVQMDKHKSKELPMLFLLQTNGNSFDKPAQEQSTLYRRVYLDIVSDKDSAQVKHLQHCGSVVVNDAVSFQDVLGPCDLPRQPAQVEGCITGQQVRQVPGLATAAAFVVFISFCYSFHFSLLAVRPLAVRKRECAASYWGRRKQRTSCKLTSKVCLKVVHTQQKSEKTSYGNKLHVLSEPCAAANKGLYITHLQLSPIKAKRA